MSNGKGSRPRPANLKQYQKNYDKVFPVKNDIETQAALDKVTGAIKLETKSSEIRQDRKVRVIKEYVDNNGVDMVIVNINDAFTNKTIPKRVLDSLEREIVNDDYVPVESTEHTNDISK